MGRYDIKAAAELSKRHKLAPEQAQYVSAYADIDMDNIDNKLPVPGALGFDSVSMSDRPREKSFSIINIPEHINNTYGLMGGVKSVLDRKKALPSYTGYVADAAKFYNAGSEVSGSDGSYMETVNKYNDFVADPKSSESVPVVYSMLNRPFAGAYLPEYSVIEIPNGPTIDENIVSNAAEHKNKGTLNHELIHRVQYKVNPGYNSPAENLGLEHNTYLSTPHELHARAATLNQLYAKNRGEAIDSDTKVNNLVDTYLKNKDFFIDINAEYRNKIDSNGNPINMVTRSAMIGNDPRYQEKMGDIRPAEAEIMYNILQGMYMKSEMINKGSKMDEAKAAKYLKALLMTTAENKQQAPQQYNGAIDNGIDIS
jgi:hypothetical protein